jgi:hypothetical protein
MHPNFVHAAFSTWAAEAATRVFLSGAPDNTAASKPLHDH